MRLPIVTRRRALLVSLTSTAALMSACSNNGSDDPLAPAEAPLAITVVSGDQQRGLAAEPLSTPLVVRVTDRAGRPVAAATVIWNVIAGGGSLEVPTTLTDGDGLARNRWTLGRPTGTGNVAARVGALASQTVTFTSTAFVP